MVARAAIRVLITPSACSPTTLRGMSCVTMHESKLNETFKANLEQIIVDGLTFAIELALTNKKTSWLQFKNNVKKKNALLYVTILLQWKVSVLRNNSVRSVKWTRKVFFVWREKISIGTIYNVIFMTRIEKWYGCEPSFVTVVIRNHRQKQPCEILTNVQYNWWMHEFFYSYVVGCLSSIRTT